MQGRTNCLSLHGDVPQRVAIGLVPKHVPPGKIKTIASVYIFRGATTTLYINFFSMIIATIFSRIQTANVDPAVLFTWKFPLRGIA